jgi:hypothetical protein
MVSRPWTDPVGCLTRPVLSPPKEHLHPRRSQKAPQRDHQYCRCQPDCCRAWLSLFPLRHRPLCWSMVEHLGVVEGFQLSELHPDDYFTELL